MFEIVITLLALSVIGFYSELTIHKFSLRSDEKGEEGGGDPGTIQELTNVGLMSFGIVCAAVWLILAMLAGNSNSELVQIGILGLLALGVVGAVWLYFRIRFK